MDPEAANGIVTRLKNDKVPLRSTRAGGRSRADRASRRSSPAGRRARHAGVGRIGFEIFDRTNFGQTDFLERELPARARGELRTIGTIAEVANARVHTMGRPSLFAGRDQAARRWSSNSRTTGRSRRRPSPPSPGGGVRRRLRPEGVTIMDNWPSLAVDRQPR
jgi:flagellar M-ring protein FliF